jgi:hypothetical protein
MYMVYWTIVEGEQHTPNSKLYETSEMVQALQFMEQLRARHRAGEPVHFVTMASEHPEMVGHHGVDVVGPDYNWKKRRK